jgi:hypothetical protein
MQNALVPNYIAPGLNSYLLNKNDCKVRLFEMTKNHELYVSPHNHRFDFTCCVLAGVVTHYTYQEVGSLFATIEEARAEHPTLNLDLYQINQYLTKGFGLGFEQKRLDFQFFQRHENVYQVGDWYGLEARTYHSIAFSRGARVLFLEGADQHPCSYFLEPVVGTRVTPIFSVPDWMYQP